MNTRMLGVVLFAGCYASAAEPRELDPPSEVRVTPVATEPSASNQAVDKHAQSIHVRTVMADAPKKPDDTANVGITISLPVKQVDCGDVLLAVVGARAAVLGERVVLTAAWSGPVDDDESEDTAPTLLWADTDMMTNLTVTGPATAEVLCDSLGVHEIRIELAPPAPCPATLHVNVECVEPTTP